jgi:hypothetical protein
MVEDVIRLNRIEEEIHRVILPKMAKAYREGQFKTARAWDRELREKQQELRNARKR